MPELYQAIRDFLTERYTLRIELGVEGSEQPALYVDVFNQTKDVPLIVHQVRIHYGSKTYSHYFRLPPFASVTIPPKDRFRFSLRYKPSETIVGRRYLTKKPPITFSDGPSFDSPADLFNAIGMGKKSNSWIEIDFNQYEQRRFEKGKLKNYFDTIGKTMRERRRALRGDTSAY